MSIIRTVLVFASFSMIAFGQMDRGGVTGVVTDPSGAAVPAASVTARNTATNATYRTQTNDSGQYTVVNLPVGSYEILVEANGFKLLSRSGISVGVSEMLRVDGALQLGAMADTVSVTAEAPRLQTETPEVGTSMSNHQLLNLPLGFSGARVAESFAFKVTPGVTGTPWQSNIAGSVAASKETLLDGASVTTNRSGHFSEGSVSVEALQEFKIQTSGLSAEYGRSTAGVFNYVMRSGANELHGSSYGALRNESLNANSFSNKAYGIKRPLDRKFIYAFGFGGPVYIPKVYDGRNRSFFYAVYEKYNELSNAFGSPNRAAPVPEFYEGDFSRLLGPVLAQKDALGRDVYTGAIYDPATFRQVGSRWVGDMFPGNRIPVSRFSQVSRNLNEIAKAGYLPTLKDASGQFALQNNVIFPAGARDINQGQFSIKGDQNINDRHKLSGSFARTSRPRLQMDQGGGTGLWNMATSDGGLLSNAGRQQLYTTFGRVAYDWTITPSLLNHLMVYANRLENATQNVNWQVDGAAKLGIKNLSTEGYPIVNWGGGPRYTLARPGNTSNPFAGTTALGISDTVNFSVGGHFFKTGIDHRRSAFGNRPAKGGSFSFAARGTSIPNETFSGVFTGYSFASYLLGIVDSAGLAAPLGLGARQTYTAAFFQDDFKVTPKLTLQLGIRWDYQGPNTEAADRRSNWLPSVIDPQSGLPGAYEYAGSCSWCMGRSFWGDRDLNNFGPRIGFAWQPARGWAVRGAWGILFVGDGTVGQTLGGATAHAWGGTYELAASAIDPWRGIFNWDAGFPTDRYRPAGPDPSYGNRNRPVHLDLESNRMGYVQQTNLNIQRELARNLILDVGYVGTKSTALEGGYLGNLNQLPPSVLAQYGTRLNNPVRNEAEALANGIPYPYKGFSGTLGSALRPYPQVVGVNTVDMQGTPLGFGTYHSFQVTLNRQFTKGLTAYGSYVWSKSMGNVYSSVDGENPAGPLDYYNLALEKSVAQFDQPHMVKMFLDYELPVGRGKALWSDAGGVANAVFGGWSISCILNYFSGSPLGVAGSTPLTGGWNGALNRANIAAGDLVLPGFDKSQFNLMAPSSATNTYLNKALFTDAAPLTLGTSAVRYAQMRGFGTVNEDLGLQKVNRFADKYRFQLRIEMLNLFNRHQLSGPVLDIRNPLFGQVTGVTGNRVMQAGARLDF